MIDKINLLPQNELSYYLILLLNALQKEPSEDKKKLMLKHIDRFVTALDNFYKEKTPKHLDNLTMALQSLVDAAKTHTWTRTIQKILLNICTAVTMLICSVLGALTGTAAGFFSEWNVLNGAYTGFLIGGAIGLKIGTYLPEKTLRNQTVSKITYSLNHLRRISSELDAKHLQKLSITQNNPYAEKHYDIYQNETKRYIIDTFFKDEVNKAHAFQRFLRTPQSYQISTAPAIFVNRNMDSTLGNHALIRYRINGKTAVPIEYGARVKTPRWVNQAESIRHVTGQKLFEMLTLDRILQETHSQTLKFRIFGFEIGNNDCHTYVQKILLGTGQKPPKIKRFTKETDTWTGYNIVRKCIEFIQINTDEDVKAMSSLYPGLRPSLSFFAKPKDRKTAQSIEGWEVQGSIHQKPLSVVCY